ncbi:MAG: aminotransferase class I/II-fold pyridoxal phosphate-dependent enzyme [Candidatus Lokiarchaeota archaeon]|nr:aminotransferase class I/II-fold pyridoxal phosphate-dependent enzyme [Candidatus Lokiarchaeota archaeon]
MKFNYIQKTPLYNALSEIGKRIFLPDGIFYWSGRAKNEAELIGTLGAAYGFEKDFIEGGSSDWVPCYLREITDYSKLSVKQIIPYTSIGGLLETRKIWKEWIIKKSLYSEKEDSLLSRLEKYITTPVITGGVTNGIFQICSMFLNPNDYIIVPNKRWGNYDNIIYKFIGAKTQSFEFFNENEMNIKGLRSAIEKIAKIQEKIVLLLNFPNNPTGYVPKKEEASKLVDMLKESQITHNKPIVVLVDDAYEPYVYKDDVLDRSIFYDLHQLDENVIPIKLDGITKELLIYGGRIGFITIGLKPSWIVDYVELQNLKEEINNKLEGFIRATISNCNSFYQELILKLFQENGGEQIIKSREVVNNLLKKRYDCINAELKKINNPNISIDPNSGGFFVFVNLDSDIIKATEFADHLLKEYKVGIIPIEKLDENVNGIRIAYCSIDKKEIPELVKRINLALNDF